MAIKLADTLAPMADFPAAMAEHIEFADGESLQKKLDDGSLGGGDSSITLTEEEYQALTEEEKLAGIFYCSDTGNHYKGGVLYSGKEPIELTYEEYKQLEADGLVESDVDYIIITNENGILLTSTDVAYDSTKTVKGKFDELDELLTDGANFYSPAPIGTVLSFAGHVAPNGYLLCDGASYKRYDYPDLYAVIGNTYGGDDVNFNVPDYRETVLVGVGENTTDTITSHDVYGLGEFKDDQFQGHWHNLGNLNGTVTVALGASIKGSNVQGANPGGENRYTVDLALDAIADGTNGEPRVGTTTHGKQKGVTYIIKAKHTNEGTDVNVVLDDNVINHINNTIASEMEENVNFSSPVYEFSTGNDYTTEVNFEYTTSCKCMITCSITGVSYEQVETDKNAIGRVETLGITLCSVAATGDNSFGMGNSCIVSKGITLSVLLRPRYMQPLHFRVFKIE